MLSKRRIFALVSSSRTCRRQLSSSATSSDSDANELLAFATRVAAHAGTSATTALRTIVQRHAMLSEAIAEPAAAEMRADFVRERNECLASLEHVVDATLFDSDDTDFGCFVEIFAGAGGVDAMDWCSMLRRMYLLWGRSSSTSSRRRRPQITVVDETNGAVGGLKSCVLRVDGGGSFARLRHEHGQHRLVRISPFDSEKRFLDVSQ